MYNQGPFANWVPKPLQLLLMLVLFFPIATANGVFTNHAQYMIGGMGLLSEDIIMANYAGIIGMAAAFPIALRLKMYFRTKEIMVFGLLSMSFLSILCTQAASVEVLIFASLWIGFFKMATLMELTLPLMFILTKDGNRIRFYTIFYGMILIFTQIGNWLSFKIAYLFSWEYSNYFLAFMLLISALICLIFQHNQRFSRKVPLYYIDWLSMLLFIVSSLCISYALSYAKQQAWFASDKIIYSSVAFLITGIWFVIRQLRLKRPYIDLSILKFTEMRAGIIMLMFLGAFLSTNGILNAYTINVLEYDLRHNNLFTLMMIPGMLLSALLTMKFLGKGITLKAYVFIGFLAYTIYSVIIYFMIVPELNYYMWFIPMVIRGFAMLTLFIGIWYYAIAKLSLEQLFSAIGILILVRTGISIAFGGGILSWVQYLNQWTSLNNLSIYMDSVNLNSLANFKNAQLNALMVSIKSTFGYITIAGMIILTYVALHHFGKTNYRRKVILYRLLKGKSVKGLRR